MTDLFWIYYIACVVYCFYKMIKKWNRDYMPGGLGITPGLDTVGMIIMAPIFAPVDIILTWVRNYNEFKEGIKKM